MTMHIESSEGDPTSSSESEYEDYSDGQEEAFNEAIKNGKEDIVKYTRFRLLYM